MITPSGIELPRVLTPALAARLGLSRSRTRTEVQRGAWRSMAPGIVLTRPDEPTRYDWAEAGVVLAGSTAAVSGWEAVRLAGVRAAQVPARAPVLVLTREHRSRRIGPVLIRRTVRPYSAQLTAFDAPLLPLTPVVTGARAVADAAIGTTRLDDVRSILARAVQLRLCTVADLVAELERCPRNGSGHLRTALGEVVDGARSVAEAGALRVLRRSRLPEFEVNVPVVDASGAVVYELDVLWRRYRAALEIEGREFHFDRDDWQATLRRHNALTAGALSVVHYPPAVVCGASRAWVGDVERWLRARADDLGLPYRPGSPRRLMAAGRPEPYRLSGFS